LAAALPTCLLLAARRVGRRRPAAAAISRLRLAAVKGGPPGPVKRRQKKGQSSARQKLDPNRPPPQTTAPKSGAWKDGTPESENMRQGEFRSPWTGQVYDRWAPIGLKQKGTDRQGGLGRARAYETTAQRKIREALNPEGQKEASEAEKFYPGMAPEEVVAREPKKKKLLRHAHRAGGFSDLFNQIVVQTVIDLKVSKKETPVWYIEPCGGEGEYHTSRLRTPDDPKPPPRWPTAEALFEVLDEQDTTYMPPELQGWLQAMRTLNRQQEGFEVIGDRAQDVLCEEGVQWLPSTTLVALQRLRKQDPVTIFEDNPISFAAMFNFVRNFSARFNPHIELMFKDGFKFIEKMFVLRKVISKAHGNFNGQRGLVFVDADWTRGSEAVRIRDLVVKLRKHWRSATVMVTYPIWPDYEHKARKFNRSVKDEDNGLDLITAELYVDTPDWTPESEQVRWRGCGVLISSPPHTTGERIRAALGVLCEELAQTPGASKMTVLVEEIK